MGQGREFLFSLVVSPQWFLLLPEPVPIQAMRVAPHKMLFRWFGTVTVGPSCSNKKKTFPSPMPWSQTYPCQSPSSDNRLLLEGQRTGPLIFCRRLWQCRNAANAANTANVRNGRIIEKNFSRVVLPPWSGGLWWRPKEGFDRWGWHRCSPPEHPPVLTHGGENWRRVPGVICCVVGTTTAAVELASS